MEQSVIFRKRNVILKGIVALVLVLMLSTSAAAFTFEVAGKEVTLMGYMNQSVAFGITGDHYDTQDGFQSAVFQGLLEARVNLSRTLRFFGSGSINADWAYHFNSSDDDWNDKGFDGSRNDLEFFDGRDLIKECHLTWTPGDFMFRAGKQIVVWGETDGVPITDQFNPRDNRRGITDVEFETTILPIWLLRSEYFMTPDSEWLTELGFQFIFNPNAEFQGNYDIGPGNDVNGIWAANVMAGPGLRVGSFDNDIEEPDSWDSDGFEYGFRIRGVISDAIVTLNYFNGVANSPVAIISGPPRVSLSPWDNYRKLVLHLPQTGYYPDFEFFGLTFARDFPGIYFEALGGVAPVLRLEVLYALDSTFVNNRNAFEESDELQGGIGVDWKFKINALNPRAYFNLYSQFVYRGIRDYPSYGLAVKENRYDYIFVLDTTYFHNKLTPAVTYWLDQTHSAELFKLELGWEQSHHWNYKIGAVFFTGDDEGDGFEPLANKDQLFFTIAYRF